MIDFQKYHTQNCIIHINIDVLAASYICN